MQDTNIMNKEGFFKRRKMLTRENHQYASRLPDEKTDTLHAQIARAVFGGKENNIIIMITATNLKKKDKGRK